MTGYAIGAVIDLLREEFPDITVSKIRFLESEGLIAPSRTQSGYRRFSRDDVGRLLYILRAQRDRYLPLKVIRDELDGMTALDTLVPDDKQAALPLADEDTGSEATTTDSDEVLSGAKLRKAAGVTQSFLDDLVAHGLIGDEPYGSDDVTIVKAAAKLTALGLEVRHLRMYRQFKERELDLIEQLMAPMLRQRQPERLAQSATLTDALLAHGDALHQALRARELRTFFQP